MFEASHEKEITKQIIQHLYQKPSTIENAIKLQKKSI